MLTFNPKHNVIPPPDTADITEQEKLDNSNIIRNISNDQSEILKWVMELYNDDEPFEADMTASELKFYGSRRGSKYDIPEPRILMDICPMRDDIIKIEPWGRLPLEDESIKSMVIDLPFIISPRDCKSVVEKKEGANMIYNRFSSYYPLDEMYDSYFHWISEAYRVIKPEGIVCFKTQSTVTGSVQANTEEWSFMCAQKVGFTVEDKFVLEAKARLISPSKYKKQQHARKYTSVFYVFKKFMKRKSKNFNYFELIEKMQEKELQRYV